MEEEERHNSADGPSNPRFSAAGPSSPRFSADRPSNPRFSADGPSNASDLDGNLTFDTSLPERHTYLGDIDDVSCEYNTFYEHGTTLKLPMFYLEGVVLFPERSLPLRILQPRFKAAIKRAVDQSNRIIGVTHVREKNDAPGIHVCGIGTIAQIRQLRRLPDGAINILTRGTQRFHLCRAWTEEDGAPCAEVRILQEGKPLHITREAFGALASVPHMSSGLVPKADIKSGPKHPASSSGETTSRAWQGATHAWSLDETRWLRRAQRAYWPHWVYRLYDAYDLARRAVDMWGNTVGAARGLTCLFNDPERVSFFIAAEMPISDQSRQDLLETDNTVERLQKEIRILEKSDRINCKICKDVIAQWSDVLVMSTDGPVSTFVNPYGFVYDILTLLNTQRLNTQGEPVAENSWFPGYAWQLCYCTCGLHMGWFFQAVKPDMHPQLFWGMRRCQIAD